MLTKSFRYWKNSLTVFILILFIPACEQIATKISLDQVAFFEYEYINHAWGYQHGGWIIDNSGEVLGYSLPNEWTFPDSTGYISEADLEKNLSQSDTIYNYQIGTSELDRKIRLISGAAKGRLSEKMNVMADAGGWSYYCYIWDDSKNKYQRILLDLKGDFEQFNMSAEALSLVIWLREIEKKL